MTLMTVVSTSVNLFKGGLVVNPEFLVFLGLPLVLFFVLKARNSVKPKDRVSKDKQDPIH